jgi:hypothetical protein
VPDHPTDAVHWHDTVASILIGNALQTADKFTAGKTKLGYKWVSQIFSSLGELVINETIYTYIIIYNGFYSYMGGLMVTKNFIG